MKIERRRTERFLFEVPVELIDGQSQKRMMAVTSDISWYGCFVRTRRSFPIGASVKVRIAEKTRIFAAIGEVMYVLANEGMGIAFGQLAAKDSAVLQEWIAEQNSEPILLRR
jgi:PilZ domain